MRRVLQAAKESCGHRLEAVRRRLLSSHWGRIGHQTLRRTLDRHSLDLSGNLAFWAFFSIFPLLLALVATLSFFFDSAVVQERLVNRVVEVLPGSADLVEQNLAAVVRLREAFGLVAITSLFWSASAGIDALSRAVSWGWGGEEATAPRFQRVRLFGMALTISLLLIAAVLLTSALRLVRLAQLWLFELVGISSPVLSITLGITLGMVPQFLMFCLIYRFLTYDQVRLRDVWPGALLATVLFDIGKQLFLLFLANFGDYDAIYGSLSSVILLQIWLYLSALIAILGAAFARSRLEVLRESS